jgi:myo-inositol-hexaphosphate 3-phosphohydrolase
VLVADVEGLAIYHAGRVGLRGQAGARGDAPAGYLLVSSQGDDTYHIYDLADPRRRVASFAIAGTGETDGHDVTNVALGAAFPNGLFVTQNGVAPPPASTDPIHGFAYDHSSQFQLVDWAAIAAPLDLVIDTVSFDPRRPRGSADDGAPR